MTRSVADAPPPSVTVSSSSTVPVEDGAVNDSCFESAAPSVTGAPLTWRHAYVVIVPKPVSALALPSTMTCAPGFTLMSAPAAATGGPPAYPSAQLEKLAMRAYSPGVFARAQPSPQLT